MLIDTPTDADLAPAVRCMVRAFAQDPITHYLLQPGPAYPARLTQFFALLMQARLALQMPVLVARDAGGIQGAAMGYGIAPALQGQGIGQRLLASFCARSAADTASSGVFLETASAANVRFYQRAGFEVTGQGRLGESTLWCMFLPQAGSNDRD